jgi:hypothetical protein
MNLLRDEELASLIAQSGGKWIFMGLESIDPGNLKSVAKGFNKPSEYRAVLERLARHDLYAITSFIFGMAIVQAPRSVLWTRSVPGRRVFRCLVS